jgi:site-specific DNA recombinase
MIIDRVINGMERKAGKGQWTLGVAPYGYEVNAETKHLVPIHTEASVVAEVFNLYTFRRQGARNIANLLNQRGHRRRSGKPWSFKTVIDVLVNPAYIAWPFSTRRVRLSRGTPATSGADRGPER